MDEKQEFAAAVSRVHTVSATSLIVGLILALIISQQMREHQAALKRLAREARSYVRQESELNARLQAERSDNARIFKHASKQNPALQRIDAQLAVRVARDATARKERLAEIDERLASNKKLIEAWLPKVEAEKKKLEEEEKNKPKNRKHEPYSKLDPREGPKHEQALALEQLQSYHANLAQYRKTYASASALRDRVEQHLKEARELRRSKQSLPTPFGQFEVSPRIGLIGVLLGLIGAQLYVLTAATRARRIAKAVQSQNSGVAITRLPAPAWLDTFRGPDLSQTLAWPAPSFLRKAGSLAIHSTWLILAGYLVWEIFRWRAAEDVLVAPSSLVYGLTIGALVTGIVAMIVFQMDAGQPLSQVSVSRRQFFILSGTVLVAAATGLIVLRRRRSKKYKKAPTDPIRIADIGERMELVVSRRTRTAHHTRVCTRHLPVEQERATTMKPTDVLHVQCRIAILTQLAKDTWVYDNTDNLDRAKTVKERKHLLDLAIRLAPLSVHLYDAFVTNAFIHDLFIESARAALASGIKRADQELAAARARLSATLGRQKQKRARIVVARLETLRTQLQKRSEQFETKIAKKLEEENRKKQKNHAPIALTLVVPSS